MRALKRAQDESELGSGKQRDIDKLHDDIDDLKQKRVELLARLAQYTQHRRYLEKVSHLMVDHLMISVTRQDCRRGG